MPKTSLSPAELLEFDRIDRGGGLRTMASPHVHDDDPHRPQCQLDLLTGTLWEEELYTGRGDAGG